MAKVLVNRTEAGRIAVKTTIDVKTVIDSEEVLPHIKAEEIIMYYDNTKYQLLDLIGQEYCMKYWNLIPNPEVKK